MSQHTAQDIQDVDDLYDRYSIPTISDMTGIPESTMCYWKSQGWISTETEHFGQHHRHPRHLSLEWENREECTNSG